MTQNVGRLGVVLGLDTAEFTAGLQKAQASVTSFVSTALPRMATAGALAFGAMTYKALQFADAMSDTAKANDMAIESILALSSSLQMAGGKSEDAGKILSKFNATIDEAAQGSKSAQESFARVGVSLADLRKLSGEDLFSKAVQNIAKIQDVAQRTGLAVSLFGRAIKGVDMKELAEGLAKGDEAYKKYAEAIRIAGDLQDQLESKTKKTLIMFTNAFIPTLNTIFEELNKGGGFFETFFGYVSEGFKNITFGVYILVDALKVTWKWLELVGNVMVDIATFDWGKIASHNKDYEEYLKRLNKEAKEFGEKLFFSKPKDRDKDAFGGRNVIDADAEAVKKAQILSTEYAMQSYLKFEQLKRQRELIALTTNEKAVAEAIYKIEDDRFNKVLDLQKKITEEKAKGKPNDKLIAELENQIEVINGVAEAYKNLTKEEMLAQQEAQRTFEFGWNKAFKQYAEDAGNAAKVASDMFTSMTSNMNSALDKFVETGKLNFKDLAKSIIQDLIKIQLRASAMKMFSSFGLGNLFGGATGLDSLPASVNRTFPTNADGGFMNGPAIVGENGPELFIPTTSGTVVPNGQIANALGSGQTVNYNGPFIANMNAIDTQSATQFIMKNKDSVWAANQSANRSMPASR